MGHSREGRRSQKRRERVAEEKGEGRRREGNGSQ